MRDSIKITAIAFISLLLISTFCNSDGCEHSVLSTQFDDTFIVNTKNSKTPLNWSEDVRLTFVEGKRAKSPAIAVNDNIIHVVYTNDSTRNIYYLRSQDNGRMWDIHKKVSNVTPDNGACFQARIAINGTNLHVVWDEYPDGGTTQEIYYANSTDNGGTWSEPRMLSDFNNSNSWIPDTAVEGDNIYVAWQDVRGGGTSPEVYFKKSTDNGKTWSDDIALTPVDGYTSGDPIIAVNGSNIHIVFGDYRDGNWETYYKRSTDGGDTWSADAPISKIDGFNSDFGRIAVNGDTLYIAWEDYINSTHHEIRYRNSTNNGDDWNAEMSITSDDGCFSSQPTIAVNGSDIHVAWIDQRDNYGFQSAYEIYSRHSTDGGITWDTELRLTTALNNSLQPSTASTKDYVHLVWMDNRTGDTTDYEIYYKRSPDFGNESFAFDFNSGWNLITLPLNNTTYPRAEDLAQAIPNCTYIRKWNSTSQAFETHVKGTNENNFTIDAGIGYFVYVNSQSTFTIKGDVISSPLANLEKKWTGLGWYNFTATHAETAGKKIANCTAVAYWDNSLGRFITHPIDTNISNFTIEMGMGYFVYIA